MIPVYMSRRASHPLACAELEALERLSLSLKETVEMSTVASVGQT